MTEKNIQIPRVEGKSFPSLGSGKAVCSEGGHKAFPVPRSTPTALVQPLSPSPHHTWSQGRSSESVTSLLSPVLPCLPLLLSKI